MHGNTQFTRDDAINDLRRTAARLGTDTLSLRIYAKEGSLSPSRWRLRFGPWPDLVRQAGLIPAYPGQRPYSIKRPCRECGEPCVHYHGQGARYCKDCRRLLAKRRCEL